jgi:acyl-coenzyme A thioesterase PaaI-like protein
VYGGLIASLIDCHAVGTAAAAAYRAQGREMGSQPALRYLTASLHVDYLRPTPIDTTLELRGQVKEIKGCKAVVTVTLSARGELCTRRNPPPLVGGARRGRKHPIALFHPLLTSPIKREE